MRLKLMRHLKRHRPKAALDAMSPFMAPSVITWSELVLDRAAWHHHLSPPGTLPYRSSLLPPDIAVTAADGEAAAARLALA